MALTESEARHVIAGPLDAFAHNSFEVLSTIAMLRSLGDDAKSRDLLLRVLERRDEFRAELHSELRGEEAMLRALVREQGLYPYVDDVDSLGVADRLAYEIHRPIGIGDIVFHAKQEEVYQLLADGRSVVLSAPTSFGKSLIIDGVIATGRYRTAVLIVPTIALIDETRRRLTRRFGAEYKIVTQAAQQPGERTIYVLTQERFLDIPAERFACLDFFAIDEFYKLDMPRDERSPLLNLAFHRLHATGAQFYLLGPNIHDLARKVYERLDFQFIKTGYETVTLDTEFLPATKADLQGSVTTRCRSLAGPTLLYVSAPSRARTVAKWLIDANLGRGSSELDDTARWIADSYHPQWFVARAVRNGIGVHHGKIPRALGHHMVRLFNEGKLPWLIVTSSLVEGVNTSAKNIVLIDRKVGPRKLDFFTYSNIRGRSGRMFKHFVGKVIVFGDAPRPDNKMVDIPAYTQGSDTPLSLLVQLPWNELSAESRERLQPIYQQQAVSLETIRAARGTDPTLIIEVAKTLHADPEGWSRHLAWNGQPTYEQLETACELLYQLAGSPRTDSVTSARQLTMRVNQARMHRGQIRSLADEQARFSRTTPDEAVDNVLGFIRDWTSHRVPRHLMVLQSITEEVLGRYDLPIGSYSHFAGTVAALFRPPMTTILEEYGLPAPLANRLQRFISLDLTANRIDEVLNQLRLVPPVAGLSGFERDVLRDTISNL